LLLLPVRSPTRHPVDPAETPLELRASPPRGTIRLRAARRGA